MRVGYSKPVLAVSTLFPEEESIFRNTAKFSFYHFLLLTVFAYKDVKISQCHVTYALFAEALIMRILIATLPRHLNKSLH